MQRRRVRGAPLQGRWWGFLWLVLTCSCIPQAALSPRATPRDFVEEQVDHESLFTFEGFSVGAMRIERFRRTQRAKGKQVVQLHVVEQGDRTLVTCLIETGRRSVRRACSVKGDAGTSALALAGKNEDPLSGVVRGPLDLTLEGLSDGAMGMGTFTPTLLVHRGDRTVGTIVPFGPRTKVRLHPDADGRERRWVRLLGLMQATLVDPRDDTVGALFGAGTVTEPDTIALDGYLLRDRNADDPPAPANHLAALARLARRLDDEREHTAATQLRRLQTIEREQVFDEKGGPRAHRSVVRGVAIEVGGGPVWVADANGAPSPSAVGGRFGFRGGLRLGETTTAQVGAGVQFPAFRLDGPAADGAPLGTYSSLAFQFDLSLRHGFDTGTGFEPVVGVMLPFRFIGMNYTAPPMAGAPESDFDVSGAGFGLGGAGILGAQWVTKLNPIGSRFVVFAECHPEVMFWPGLGTSDDSGGTVPGAAAVMDLFGRFGPGPTLQVGTSAGVRLEL